MGNSESKPDFKTSIEVLFQSEFDQSNQTQLLETLKLPQTPEDVFVCIGPLEADKLWTTYPKNLETLLSVCADLCLKVSQGELHHGQNLTLNAVRVITRVLPFLLQNPEASAYLWSSGLAMKIIQGLRGLMFVYDFSIPIVSELSAFEMDPGRLWEEGLYAESVPSASGQMRKNRTELLRAVIACCSEVLYLEYASVSEFVNSWSWVMCSWEIKFGKDLFYSLVNSALTCKEEHTIPYGGYGYYSEEANYSCQLLNIMLDSKLPSQETVQDTQELQLAQEALLEVHNTLKSVSSETYINFSNVFVDCAKELDEVDHFQFICKSLSKHFTDSVRSRASFFGSEKDPNYLEQLLFLLWNFVEKNSSFETYLVQSEYLIPILDFMLLNIYEYKDNISKAGLIQMCVFLLLHFSSLREFALQTSKEYGNHLPISLSGLNYYFDVVVCVFYEILHQKSHLLPLVSSMVTILLNLSAYVKFVGKNASVKLFSMFEYFSSKKFMYKEQFNYVYLGLMLELVNNRLQYQWDGSLYLVYNIICNKALFESLDKFKADSTAEANWELTEDWETKVKETLNLSLVKAVLKDLLPRIEKVCEFSEVSEADIYNFLTKTTMVGAFPQPHPLYLRKFQSNSETVSWFTSYLWGLIYMQNQKLPLFDYRSIKLFTVTVNEMAS